MTDADWAAQRRLSAIWAAAKAAAPHDITQAKLAEQWGDDSITQGAISQYLTGKIPLNLTAVLRFAQFLKRQPQEIRSDLPELKRGSPGALDAYGQELFALWPQLDEATKQFLTRTARERAGLQSTSTSPFRKPITPTPERRRAPY